MFKLFNPSINRSKNTSLTTAMSNLFLLLMNSLQQVYFPLNSFFPFLAISVNYIQAALIDMADVRDDGQ